MKFSKTVTVTIESDGGRKKERFEIAANVHGGVAIHRPFGFDPSKGDKGWHISHARSGLRVASAPTQKAAQTVRRMLLLASHGPLWWASPNPPEDHPDDERTSRVRDAIMWTRPATYSGSWQIDRVKTVIRLGGAVPEAYASDPDIGSRTHDESIAVKVRNTTTGETLDVALDAATVLDSVQYCTGPCECGPLEPDADSPCGWPMPEQAIIRHG